MKALAPKSEIDLEKMTFGSVPVDGTLAVEGLSPDGATMFVVTCGFVTISTTYGDGNELKSTFSAGQVFFLQGVDGFKHTFSVSETKWPLENISKYSPNPWRIGLLSPLSPGFFGWLALVLHGFGECLPTFCCKCFVRLE